MDKGKPGKNLYGNQSQKKTKLSKLSNQIQEESIKDFDPENKYRLLLESGLVAFFALSTDGTIVDVNETFIKYLGFSSSEMIKNNIRNFMEAENANNLINSLLQNKSILLLTYPIKKKNGDIIHAQLSGKALKNNETGDIYHYFIFSDITDKIKSNEHLKQQNLNLKIKDELITSKELELKKQNLELLQLNKTLNDRYLDIDDLNSRIVENELRLKLAFDAVNDGIWDWNLISNEIYFSDRFFTMLGYDPFDYSHSIDSWLNLLHPEESVFVKGKFDSALKGLIREFSLEYRMRTKQNNYLWILSRGKVVEEDSKERPIRMLGTHIEITNRKETELILKENESKLKEQNEEYANINKKLEVSNQKISLINRQLQDKQAHLNSIFKTVPASIGLVSDNIILFANDYTSLMTGYEIDEIIGQDTLFFYPTQEEYNHVNETLFVNNTEGKIKSVNTAWKMKNGTLIDVFLTVTFIDLEISSGYTFSALDVTDRRLYEEELIKSREEAEKADKLKTIFLANMSHELRTPMNGIVGFAEMLQNQISQSKKEQYLKIIVNSSKQLLKIITDIVDISKIETGEIETFQTSFSLFQLFQELYNYYTEYLANRNKLNIKLDFKFNLPDKIEKIIADENKLRQVITNLLNNAVKFTDSGNISFGCSLNNNFIEFYISDTGIGIIPEDKDVVFECFRQVDSPTRKKYGGNGLGLAIAKGFVKAMGGIIYLKSEKDKGSTFYFTIPYIPDIDSDKVEEFKASYGSDLPWEKTNLLVVEDDLTCLNLIQAMLEETGIKINHAITGLEAVKECRKNPLIDLVLMDMRLPEMDGYEATKRIKEFRPELPIIAQTAHALSEDRKKCLAAGCNDYLVKPVNQEILFNTIAKFLKQ